MIDKGFLVIVIVSLLWQAQKTLSMFRLISEIVEMNRGFTQDCVAFRRQIVKDKKRPQLTLDRLRLIEAADVTISAVQHTHALGAWRVWLLSMVNAFYVLFELAEAFAVLLLIGRALGIADFDISLNLIRELYVVALLVGLLVPRLIDFLLGKYDEFLSPHLALLEMARQMRDDDLPLTIRQGLLQRIAAQERRRA